MLIKKLTTEACVNLLNRSRLGRLGCAHEGQPYVTPFYFAYQDGYFYGFSTVGQKIEWMRMNSKVCVEVDEVSSEAHWITVVVLGRYEELRQTPEFDDIRDHAYRLLGKHAMWWETAAASRSIHRPAEPLFYRIEALQITGHSAEPRP